VNSQPGEGTEFVIAMPLSLAEWKSIDHTVG
jgi:chemotaxis protein histidine kinase CheA